MIVFMQMWRVVATAVIVAALAHHTSADVIVLTANQTVTMFADSPASFGPAIPIDGFVVRFKCFLVIAMPLFLMIVKVIMSSTVVILSHLLQTQPLVNARTPPPCLIHQGLAVEVLHSSQSHLLTLRCSLTFYISMSSISVWQFL